jgi:hypothetical protein
MLITLELAGFIACPNRNKVFSVAADHWWYDYCRSGQMQIFAQYGTPLKKVKLHKSDEDLLDDVQQYSTMLSHVEQLACCPYDLSTCSSRPAEAVSYLTSLEVLAVECDFVSTTVLSSILYAVAEHCALLNSIKLAYMEDK